MFFGIPRDEIYERDTITTKVVVTPSSKIIVIRPEDGYLHSDQDEFTFHVAPFPEFWDNLGGNGSLIPKVIMLPDAYKK